MTKDGFIMLISGGCKTRARSPGHNKPAALVLVLVLVLQVVRAFRVVINQASKTCWRSLR